MKKTTTWKQSENSYTWGNVFFFVLLLVEVDCLSGAVSVDDSRSIDISFLSSLGLSILSNCIINFKLDILHTIRNDLLD